MKLISVLIGLFLACSTTLAKEPDNLRAKVCNKVVEFTQKEKLDYSFKDCLKTIEIGNIGKIYDPDPASIDRYEFEVMEYNIDFSPYEQWLYCEFEVDAPIAENQLEDFYCSVEG